MPSDAIGDALKPDHDFLVVGGIANPQAPDYYPTLTRSGNHVRVSSYHGFGEDVRYFLVEIAGHGKLGTITQDRSKGLPSHG